MRLPQFRFKWIGALKELVSRSTFYISMMNFVMLAITAYYTTIRHFVHIPFYVFFIALLIIWGSALVFEYMVVLPSQIAFMNVQIYEHNNLIRRDLEKVIKKLNEIEERLDKLER